MATSTSTSYLNTPQAVDDFFTLTDNAGTNAGLTETNPFMTVSGDTITLDVLGNDLGGNAKKLVDVVFGAERDVIRDSNLVNDLLRADTTAATGTDGSANISNGRVTFTMSPALKAAIDALPAGEVKIVNLTYSIQLANGTFSFATAELKFVGVNDAATITGTSTGSVTEDNPAIASGQLTVTDGDTGQASFVVASSLTTDWGTFTFNTTTGAWTFTIDNAATQKLGAGDFENVTLTVTSLDGTATQTITVTVNGVNDLATISGNDAGEVTEDDT
ncbi:VCBS domain-containing protein, partial [Rhodobacteraceae bacterium HSP-20]